MSDNDNVVNLVNNNDNEVLAFDEILVRVKGSDSTYPIKCDMYGTTDHLPDMLVCWKDGSEAPVAFLPLSSIAIVRVKRNGEFL